MKKKFMNAAICSVMGACVMLTAAGCSTGQGSDSGKSLKNIEVSMVNAADTVRLSDRTENPYNTAAEKLSDRDGYIDDNGCEDIPEQSGTVSEQPAENKRVSEKPSVSVKPDYLSEEEINAVGVKKLDEVVSNAKPDKNKSAGKTLLETKVFSRLHEKEMHILVTEYMRNEGCVYFGDDDDYTVACAAEAEYQVQGGRQYFRIEYNFGDESFSDSMLIKDGKVYELDNIEKTYYEDEIDEYAYDVIGCIADLENYFDLVPEYSGTIEIKGQPTAFEIYDLMGEKMAVYFMSDNYCKVEQYSAQNGVLCGYETVSLGMPIDEKLFEIPEDYENDDTSEDFDEDDFDDVYDDEYDDEYDEMPWYNGFVPKGYDPADIYGNGSFDLNAVPDYNGYDWSKVYGRIYDYLNDEGSEYLKGLYDSVIDGLGGGYGTSDGRIYNDGSIYSGGGDDTLPDGGCIKEFSEPDDESSVPETYPKK